MSRLNILTVSALIALTAIVSCDEQYDYYKIGKNNPTVTTLEVSEEQVGEDWADLSGSVRWEQSTSNHSFSCRFAISESPDFPVGETDTLYGETSGRKSIAQDDTTTHYYDATVRELKQGTTYYYAFSITDGIVEVSGQAQSFTTLGESSGTEGPRLVIPEPECVADDIGGYASVPFMIENYDIELYGELTDEMFLVEHGDGGEDWIRDMGYDADYPENQCVGSVFFIVDPNETGSDRSCSISVRLSIEGVVEQEEFIYVTQPSMSAEEPNLVMPEGTEFSVEAEGGDYDTFIPFTIENYSYEYYESHGEPELWIENGADWLSNVEYAYLEYGEDCTGYINLTAEPNTTGSDRTGDFTFGFNDQSYNITISQPQLDTDLDVTGQLNGHDYVDLGLSVMWATCNVGSSEPYLVSNNYAWGETETKLRYSRSNSKTLNMDFDEDISGDSQYDAATANWGNGWRIPTEDEFRELIEKCDWNASSIRNGYVVTGPNGNSMYVPITGYRDENQGVTSSGYGYYWSSSPSSGKTWSYCLRFSKDGYCDVDSYSRDLGFHIRAVTDY